MKSVSNPATYSSCIYSLSWYFLEVCQRFWSCAPFYPSCWSPGAPVCGKCQPLLILFVFLPKPIYLFLSPTYCSSFQNQKHWYNRLRTKFLSCISSCPEFSDMWWWSKPLWGKIISPTYPGDVFIGWRNKSTAVLLKNIFEDWNHKEARVMNIP